MKHKIIKAQEGTGKGLSDVYEQWKAKQKHPVYSYSEEPWQEKYTDLVKNLLSEVESTRSDNTQDIYSKEPITPATPEQIQYYNDNIKFVTDYNRENNTNFENRDQIQQYEEATKPGLNMVINVPAMYGTATGTGNTQIWDPRNRVPSTVGAEISQVTIPLTFALAGGAAGTIPQLLTNGAFYIEAAKNFSSPEGIAKTKNLLSKGKYSKAALSGLGDALDLSIMLGGSGSAIRAAKNVANLRKLMALKTVPMQELKSIGYNIPAVAYNNGGIMQARGGKKILKSFEELGEAVKKRPRIRVSKTNIEPASVRTFIQKPIEFKPVEIKPINFTVNPTAQEILSQDPSAYMNALTSAQRAAEMNLPELSNILYKDASWLNPQKDAFKSRFLWGELYENGGKLK